jgi:dTDP-4-dehydrorhamnose 3,5-epimerase
MEVRELALPGLIELVPSIFKDERGYFFESYNKHLFEKIGISVDFMQDNQSFSKRGVIRGLHLQSPPYEQGKLVRVITGSVLDVVVDVRKKSLTYGQYLSLELNDEKKNMLYIPAGFAHGFAALSDCIFHYKCTNGYAPKNEMGINPLDSSLSINWQIENPNISAKDEVLGSFNLFSSPF